MSTTAAKTQKIRINKFILPAYWAPALINADSSGLTDQEEEEIKKFLERVNPGNCVGCSEEEYFSHSNDAGTLAGNVLEYSFHAPKKEKFLTFKNPDTAIKLTVHQAKSFGIDVNQEEQRGEIKTVGMWQIPVSFRAVCMSATFEQPNGYTVCTEKILYGIRTMQRVKSSGYELDGQVSINGRKYSAFTSSQLFEVNGKLLNVAIIHARI